MGHQAILSVFFAFAIQCGEGMQQHAPLPQSMFGLANERAQGSLGGRVALDNAGYRQVLASKDEEAMKAFILRVMDGSDMGVANKDLPLLDSFAGYVSQSGQFKTLPALKSALELQQWIIKKFKAAAASIAQSFHNVADKLTGKQEEHVVSREHAHKSKSNKSSHKHTTAINASAHASASHEPSHKTKPSHDEPSVEPSHKAKASRDEPGVEPSEPQASKPSVQKAPVVPTDVEEVVKSITKEADNDGATVDVPAPAANDVYKTLKDLHPHKKAVAGEKHEEKQQEAPATPPVVEPKKIMKEVNDAMKSVKEEAHVTAAQVDTPASHDVYKSLKDLQPQKPHKESVAQHKDAVEPASPPAPAQDVAAAAEPAAAPLPQSDEDKSTQPSPSEPDLAVENAADESSKTAPEHASAEEPAPPHDDVAEKTEMSSAKMAHKITHKTTHKAHTAHAHSTSKSTKSHVHAKAEKIAERSGVAAWVSWHGGLLSAVLALVASCVQ